MPFSPACCQQPEGDGAVIFEHACRLGLEGIVCKRTDLPYKPGPSKSWIKVKNKKYPAMLRVKEAFELENLVNYLPLSVEFPAVDVVDRLFND